MSQRKGTEGMELLGPLNWILGPIMFVAGQIADQADEALMDEKPIINELTRIGADLDAGRMEEAEFMELEAELLERLEWIEGQKAAMMSERNG